MQQLKREIEETQKRLESLTLALKKAENKPEMIDLPEGIEFTIKTGKWSHGILFNKNRQELSVSVDSNLYSVREAGGMVIIQKPDYCLIKSTREECMKTGEVFVAFDFGRIEKEKENITHWGIGLTEQKYACAYENCSDVSNCIWYHYYRLVKRSEV